MAVKWEKNNTAIIIKSKVIMRIKKVKIMISKRRWLNLPRNNNSKIKTWIKDSSSSQITYYIKIN
jgi:hypothetical protein